MKYYILPTLLFINCLISLAADTLQTVQEEFFDTIPLNCLQAACTHRELAEDKPAILNNIKYWAQVFKHNQIKKENEALAKNDASFEQAFREQWYRESVAATILLVATAYKPSPQPTATFKVFQREPYRDPFYAQLWYHNCKDSHELLEPLQGQEVLGLFNHKIKKSLFTQGIELNAKQKVLLYKAQNLKRAVRCAGECAFENKPISPKYANASIVGICHEQLVQSILEHIPAELKEKAIEEYREEMSTAHTDFEEII